MQKWIVPLNIGLAVAIVALLALIGSDIIAFRLAKVFPAGERKTAATPATPAAVEDLMAFSPILEKGLFGKATQGKLSPIVAAPSAKAAAPSLGQGDLILLGTAIGSFRETFALMLAAENLTRRFDAVEQGHRDVEDRDIGLELEGQPHRFSAVARLADHLESGPFLEDLPQTLADEGVVVGQQDANGPHRDAPSLAGSAARWTSETGSGRIAGRAGRTTLNRVPV